MPDDLSGLETEFRAKLADEALERGLARLTEHRMRLPLGVKGFAAAVAAAPVPGHFNTRGGMTLEEANEAIRSVLGLGMEELRERLGLAPSDEVADQIERLYQEGKKERQLARMKAEGRCAWCDSDLLCRGRRYIVEGCEDLWECDRCFERANGNEKHPRTWIGKVVTWLFGEMWGARRSGF